MDFEIRKELFRYMELVIKESLRKWPVAPIVGRQLEGPLQVFIIIYLFLCLFIFVIIIKNKKILMIIS